MIEVMDELSGERMNQALGRTIIRLDEEFSAQPMRQKAIAVAVGRDSVDIVVATKPDSGIVTYQHSKEHGLSLNRESLGLRHLVAAIIASTEANGYKVMEPPAHTPKTCVYVGPYMPLKYTIPDWSSTMHGTQVYQVEIKKHGSNELEPAILKVCSSILIRIEVRSLRVPRHLGQKSHYTKMDAFRQSQCTLCHDSSCMLTTVPLSFDAFGRSGML